MIDQVEFMTVMCEHTVAQIALQKALMQIIEQAKGHVADDVWQEFMEANKAIHDTNKKFQKIMQGELN